MATAQLSTLLRHIRKLGQPSTDRQLLDDFQARGDETAFTALVGCHGPMVLRVCRRVLGHEQDAEDAFQATFLVLARSVGSIRRREALAGWLHGVAYRTAMKAKRSAARRRNHEAKLRALPPKTSPAPRWHEVQAVLDEEIQRLPESFRSAFILCALEGNTKAEAADKLGCKEGTISSRLDRARKLLQQRLARRGIKLTVLLGALSLVESGSEASVPAALVRTVSQFGLLVAAGGPAARVIPVQVARLATGVTRAMFLTKSKLALAMLFAGVVCAAATCWAFSNQQPPSTAEPEAGAPKKSPQATAPRAADEEFIDVRGRVLDAGGKPLPGARLFVYDGDKMVPAPQRTADGDGRFSFQLKRDPEAEHRRCLLAAADGYGCDWIPTYTRGEWTLQMHKEVPIRGRVVDLQGRAVAGASVWVTHLEGASERRLDEFLRAWNDPKLDQFEPFKLLDKGTANSDSLALAPAIRTDADGRFTLHGIGPETVASVCVQRRGIADQVVFVVTRPGFRPSAPDVKRYTLLGPDCQVVVADGKSISGMITDKETGKPIAGVSVSCRDPDPKINHWVRTTTDAAGRYRLDGLAKRPHYSLLIEPPAGGPYLWYPYEAKDSDALEIVKADVGLVRGVAMSGRLIDKETGKPVRGQVQYRPLRHNEALSNTPGINIGTIWPATSADAEGRYRLTALSGPGIIVVRAGGIFVRRNYVTAKLAPKDNDPRIIDTSSRMFQTAGGDILALSFVNAYRVLQPTAGQAELKVDFTLDPGQSRLGRVVDPEGKPLAGVEAAGLSSPIGNWEEPLTSADFKAMALEPAQPRRVAFRYTGRKLAAIAVLRGDEPEPVIVKLQPLGAVTGRLLDAEGKPIAGASVQYWVHRSFAEGLAGWVIPGNKPLRIASDGKGRFRIDGLIAGLPLVIGAESKQEKRYFTHVVEPVTVLPGKTKDLGDIRPDSSR
jgi:RNA polymerase sigma factor (sigma-70 family)